MEINGIFTAIVFGLVIGGLGRLVLPGRQGLPIWVTLLVGVVAGLAGTFVAHAFGVDDTDGIELFLQVGLAALGVALVAGAGRRRRL